MRKKRLILDFDNCITNSISAFCTVYNQIYGETVGFIPADPLKVQKYDFSDQAPMEKNPKHIFNLGYFFVVLKFMPNAKEVITELSKKYDIEICSIGSYENLEEKSKWLRKNLPFIKAILINNQNLKTSKSEVNMKNAIFVDDCFENLESSNAKTKICFGKKYEWNEKWEGQRAENWLELKKLLL